MAYTKPTRVTYEQQLLVTSTGASAWRRFGPCRGRGMAVVVDFSTASTAGTSLKVQGSMTSASTADAFLIAQRKSSAGQNHVQVLSTSGALAKVVCFLRTVSSGGFSATKWARVRVVSLPSISS